MKSRSSIYVRTIAFILLIAMFHYVAGYRLMYSLGILYAKDEAKECMVEKENNKKLTFNSSEYNSLKWSEANKEFSYNSQMYDVVSIQKSGGTYYIIAYVDDPETELVEAFHSFEKELFHPDQNANGTKSAENIMSSFQKDCTPIYEFKVNSYIQSGLSSQPVIADKQQPLYVSDNIWHPPATC
jgi:hypothetical protein